MEGREIFFHKKESCQGNRLKRTALVISYGMHLGTPESTRDS